MENPFALGFVAVFDVVLDRRMIAALAVYWLDRYERLEQVVPKEVATVEIAEPGELLWEEHMQFRVIHGAESAWVYISAGSRVAETTGMPNGDEPSLCLRLLVDLPELGEVVSSADERRLDELEREGLL